MQAQQLIVQYLLMKRQTSADVLQDRSFFLKAVFFSDRSYKSDIRMLRNMDANQVPRDKIEFIIS